MRYRTRMDRRSLLRGMTALGAAFVGTRISIERAWAADTHTIKLQLGWLAGNGILGELAADQNGYFAEEGLALDVVAGGPNVDGVASVASGRAEIGSISSSPSLMLARSQGLPVKCIAAGYQQHPFTYFSLEKNPVREPKDLIGKTVATNGTARILLQALLAANGIPEDQVEVLVMGADMSPLLTGQADVVTGWKTNVSALSVLGPERVDMTLWDAGIKLYANPYYVTDKSLNENPEQVRGMLRAIARGWGWVHDNPEAAVDILVSRYPNLDRDAELAAVGSVVEYSFNEVTREHGWGTMTRENWQAQIDIYDRLGQFEGAAPAVDDVMTLSVLDEIAAVRPVYG
ncbi:ABC transporter substrate-binding protein (plasmid) [Paracoccus versutus]|uniref:Thiamine pyrimidine synthase n=2 Tax=Paracoccus versutus TaxID=34007 RepID=A0AAQ0HGB6_PARVE|nr:MULTISPECIES: ABC transporter substrate-binding protein [Paracoccus]WGR61878.1 ABC transporter substrate-binding protein [Paracoccus ferrooxidans]KGJ12129.1 nitrate ABC transporter substrate-binding protein [Paracoccus versutus]MCJ1900007.1 ABC transporter substrate-binding protein [Paracoccus versutus]MDF3904435.1 ABC transporter substrate-binding protein [Paracoccus sp. AS002]REG44593.1 NitT/TauT family transport system substrate-binding protein [Paracoccus versutus]